MVIEEPVEANSWRSDGPFSSFASRATVLALAFFAGFVGVRVLTTEATTTTVSSPPMLLPVALCQSRQRATASTRLAKAAMVSTARASDFTNKASSPSSGAL